MKYGSFKLSVLKLACCALAVSLAPAAQAAWQPTKPVTFVVPAGTGGGADQMARFVQGVISKYHLMNQPLMVVNEKGGAGAQGFMDVKSSQGDPHKLIITLSNVFTTPLATGIPFSYKELTPVSMLALDEFVLWVNAKTPYHTPKDYITACKASAGKCKMGGTGAKQEDQIITAAIEKKTGVKFTYLPFHGGGKVAVQLVGGHIDSSVNNPLEAVAHWRAGNLRPLCVFDSKPMPYTEKMAGNMSWHDIPTCKSQGLDVEYTMLRGIMMPGGVKPDQVAYYVNLFKKVEATPDWKKFMATGAFNQTHMTGAPFKAWLDKAAAYHYNIMKSNGWLAKK